MTVGHGWAALARLVSSRLKVRYSRNKEPPGERDTCVMELAELEQLCATLLADLDGFVRFFDKGGVDHERGGVCCGLAATGERLTGLKFVWFNGRGIWTYARLHNSGLLRDAASPRPEKDSMQRYLLNVASGARDFALTHGRDAAGGFVVEMDESGKPLRPAEPNYVPTSGYGSAFVAEGLTELFRATGNIADADLAVQLLRAFVALMDDPARPGDAGPWPACYPGMRTLGHHMICISLARQLHEALSDAYAGRGSEGSGPSQPPPLNALPTAGPLPAVLEELEALLDRVVAAVLGPFLHPTHGLLSECLAHDYGRAPTQRRSSISRPADPSPLLPHAPASMCSPDPSPLWPHAPASRLLISRPDSTHTFPPWLHTRPGQAPTTATRTSATSATPSRRSGWSWRRRSGGGTRRCTRARRRSSGGMSTRRATTRPAASTAASSWTEVLAAAAVVVVAAAARVRAVAAPRDI